MTINDNFSNIILAILQQRIGMILFKRIYLQLKFIDFILNKKIFDHFDSFDKLEGYVCSIRHSLFFVYPVSSSLIFMISYK